MANKARGEIAIKLGEETITLVLDIRSLAEIEEEFPGRSFIEVLADALSGISAGRVSAKLLIGIMRGCLRAQGHDPELTYQATALELGKVIAPLMMATGMFEATDRPPEPDAASPSTSGA